MNNFPAMTQEHRDSLIDWAKGYIYAAEIYVASNPADRSGKAYLELLQIALAALTAKSIAWIETGTDGFQRGSRLINYFTSDIQGFDNGTLIYAAPPAPVLRVPAGWKLVPMVPTEAMIMAAQDSEDVLFDKDDDSLFIVDHKEIYRAMLENAPEASNEQ